MVMASECGVSQEDVSRACLYVARELLVWSLFIYQQHFNGCGVCIGCSCIVYNLIMETQQRDLSGIITPYTILPSLPAISDLTKTLDSYVRRSFKLD